MRNFREIWIVEFSLFSGIASCNAGCVIPHTHASSLHTMSGKGHKSWCEDEVVSPVAAKKDWSLNSFPFLLNPVKYTYPSPFPFVKLTCKPMYCQLFVISFKTLIEAHEHEIHAYRDVRVPSRSWSMSCFYLFILCLMVRTSSCFQWVYNLFGIFCLIFGVFRF